MLRQMKKMTDKNKCFVGFDTSNYTTSIAVCDIDGNVVANLKAPLSVSQGERGLRQSDAVFAHIKNLPMLSDKLAEVLREYEPLAVGVSAFPRDAENSYMPCFLCGIVAAKTFAAQNSLHVYNTAHQNGHIMAAIYSSGVGEKLLEKPFLAFHVSGGTTEALLVIPSEDKSGFSVKLVGETADINAGQAIDRAGVMMGLTFPAGKELEILASQYSGKLERKKICVRDMRCNLSGIENISKELYSKTKDKQLVAAVVFDFICRTLCEMTEQIFSVYGTMPILFAGGVMSNKLMRKDISSRFEAYFAEPEFSADNAAGVALLCRLKYIREMEIL